MPGEFVKRLPMCLGPFLILMGCNHGYILSSEDTLRISTLPEYARPDVAVTAIPNAALEPAQSHEQHDALRVAVRADRLDLAHRKWIRDGRFFIPAKRPIGLLVSGGISLGLGMIFSVAAGITQADQSCKMIEPREQFLGRCGGRDLLTIAFSTAGGLHSIVGIGLLIGAAAKWSPELRGR